MQKPTEFEPKQEQKSNTNQLLKKALPKIVNVKKNTICKLCGKKIPNGYYMIFNSHTTGPYGTTCFRNTLVIQYQFIPIWRKFWISEEITETQLKEAMATQCHN